MNEEVVQSIKQEALNDNIPIILDDTLNALNSVLAELKPNKILEIGTATGYSAICFSRYLEINGKIDTIEKDPIRIEKAKENIQKLNLQDTITIYEGDALGILPNLENTYDLVFIDAVKSKYPIFLEHAIRLTRSRRIYNSR